jgi:hypothetical protein
VGLYLAQLPPAELARLKAELAETLIANFCYPRYLDYRTNTLRMRPVDRAKRQEVWSFLSSYDFAPWGRIDVQSPDFHRLVERLFIQYIQRNRAFFGNLGRKRMTDVRSLIGSSSVFVTEGLRSHLTGRQSGQPFGSPRLVVSWGGSTADPSWEQVAGATQLLQQQVQSTRDEIQAEHENGARPLSDTSLKPPTTPAVPPRRSARNRASSNGSGKIQAIIPPKPVMPPQVAPPISATPTVAPTPSPLLASPQKVEDVETIPFSNSQPLKVGADQVSSPRHASSFSQSNAPTTMRELSRTPSSSLAAMPTPGTPLSLEKSAENAAIMLSDEDVVIFEQMKYQLVVWLRVEAIRLGMDISNQMPLQLVELLRHQEDFDETRLQVVTTLLHLADTVIDRGQAALIDYKQAMMFYLMHTRRAR